MTGRWFYSVAIVLKSVAELPAPQAVCNRVLCRLNGRVIAPLGAFSSCQTKTAPARLWQNIKPVKKIAKIRQKKSNRPFNGECNRGQD